jgi:mannose-6-phosphate isomerase-like protein (cupin superfamily)
MQPETDTQRYKMKMYVKDTISITPEELESKYVARFDQLVDDSEIFADIKTQEGRRRHFHVISENNHLGPARITTPHNFHVSYLEVPPNTSAALHAHDLPEIFIPMTGRFAILFGDHGENSVELAPLDTISVPVGLMRTFKNIGNTNGILMVIYDGPGEVLGKIYVNSSTAEDMRQKNPVVARDFGLMDSDD